MNLMSAINTELLPPALMIATDSGLLGDSDTKTTSLNEALQLAHSTRLSPPPCLSGGLPPAIQLAPPSRMFHEFQGRDLHLKVNLKAGRLCREWERKHQIDEN